MKPLLMYLVKGRKDFVTAKAVSATLKEILLTYLVEMGRRNLFYPTITAKIQNNICDTRFFDIPESLPVKLTKSTGRKSV